MPLTPYALDNFVAQDMSKLTECQMVSVASDFPDYSSWISSFVLNGMLNNRLPKDKTALAFAIIRRAEGAIEDHEAARAHLEDFVNGDPIISSYFRCLRKLESTLAMVSQAHEVIRKALNRDFFDKNDGSPYQRLNHIYNRNRHDKPETFPSGNLHAVWIKNDGLYEKEANLTFDELRDLIHRICHAANKMAKGEVPG